MASKKTGLIALLSTFAMATTALFPILTSTASAANATPKGDLVVVRNQDLATLDPDPAQNDSIFIQEQMYEPLFQNLQNGKGVVPLLAKSSSLGKDGLTWTIPLRTDVKFSDGTPMTSADVKFSIDRATAGPGWGFLNTAIASVSAPSPHLIIIKTKFPWAPLLADLANFSNSVLKANYNGETPADFFKNPIATGPFMLDHWTPGTEVKLVANKYYWQPGKPYLNSVTYKYVADDNTREFMLKGGQADINEEPPANTVVELKASPGIKVGIFSAAASNYLAFNEKVPALADVHVRRAISYAIDRASINKIVYSNNGTVSNSFLAPSVNFYDKTTPGQQYDLKKAAAELAQSKFKKGLKLDLLIRGGDRAHSVTASIVQAALKKIGITMTITPQEPTVERAAQKAMNYQMTLEQWTMDIVDPDE